MMKRFFVLLIFVAAVANAQFSVKGTMTPPEKSDWVVLYRIDGAKQKFISNSTIKFEDVDLGGSTQKVGRFELTLPADAKAGAYRVSYRNTGAGFVDFFFNKENVEFVFNPQFPEESVLFTKSRENKVYREYTEALSLTQRAIDSLQVEYLKSDKKKTKKAYKKAYKEQEEVQEIYEGKSEGMLVNTFIKASEATNSDDIFDDTQEYLDHVLNSFFDNIDFSDKTLYNSPFIIDRVTNYVFYLNIAESQSLQQKLYKESIEKIMGIIKKDATKKEILEYLITRFTIQRNSEIVDEVFEKYYDKLPANLQDAKFKEGKLAELSVSVGRTAPDFSWKEDGKDYSLSTLDDGEYYLMIFWSTQCGHCVKEVPEVHEFMKEYDNTSVIAFAIEENDLDFNSWAKNKLYNWHNVLGTHPTYKFDNEVVQKYRIDATPTYFILDKDKKIIAVPNAVEDIKEFLNKEKTASE
ncbi:TlpA family protein disulfide reductase [Tenacibaculum jejuense]|uniref:AhpC/TSA family protein n=1 Tax=Tenacibaculum jejuense TaxID=584609 RepID=A0A238UEC5_9FLAO|nr:TlpA disulfide reductase family protein [Tenacibaculum jejuense]SNR17405.1 AhpC/TSA family protein [Tenacibaculum jejuense]